MRNDDWLNGVMGFDHPVRVNEDGSVTESIYPNIYAPESVIETTHDGSVLKEHEDRWIASLRDGGWEPARGYSSQDRYHGPVMHACESIGGSLETYILATPGVWVAVTVECLRGDPDGAGEGFDPDTHTCGDCRDSLDEPYDDEEPAGWAVLHMDDGPDTESYVVTTRPGEITPALISSRCRVTLPVARKLTGLVPHLRARIVRVTDLAIMPNETPAWFSAETDNPGDQQRDLNVPRDNPAAAGFWGLVGPGHPDGWDWSVIDGADSETVASGHREDEDEAKAAVDAWELRHQAVMPAEGCPDGNLACDRQACPEHPAHDGGDHTYEQHHSPSDHAGPGPCLCGVYTDAAQAGGHPDEKPDITTGTISQRLEAIRASLRAENISYGELAELQSLAGSIEPGDTELLEAAGVPEHDDNPDPAANYQDGPCGDH